MNDNLQEQRDEVLALESILAETGRLEVLDGPDVSEGHVFLIQIQIPVKLEDDGITVELRLPGEEDVSLQQGQAAGLPQGDRPKIDRSISGKHWNCSARVKHLPPLVLHVSLPTTYPSEDPPNAYISAVWLNTSQIIQLQGQLQQLWKECANMPILYTWIDWLENSLLSFMDISDTLILQWTQRDLDVNNADGVEYNQDDDDSQDEETDAAAEEAVEEEGAVGGENTHSDFFKRQVSIELQADLLFLVRYSLEKELKDFTNATHECCICFCAKSGNHFVRLNQCKHNFCKDCATIYCTEHVKEGTVDSLQCPDPDCDTELPPGLVHNILDEKTFERYEKLTLQRALDKMGDVTWCPRCNQPAIKESNSDMASCGHCYFVFCLKCKSTWHSGSDCSPYFRDIQRLLDSMQGKGCNKKKTLAEIQKMLEIASGISTVRANTKPCPHCSAPIQKHKGCNSMICINCSKHFSWNEARWSSSTDYMSEAADSEKLFSEAIMVKGYQLSQIIRDLESNVQGLDVATSSFSPSAHPFQHVSKDVLNYPYDRRTNKYFSSTPCPECKQTNVRGKFTDVIKCISCSMEYCYNCLQLLTKSTKKSHLVNGECKKEGCTKSWTHGNNCPCMENLD